MLQHYRWCWRTCEPETQFRGQNQGIFTHQCLKSVGITQWQDGRPDTVKKLSKLFTKIATAKAATAKAKEQQNILRIDPIACQAVPLPRVVNRPPIPASPLPRVPVAPEEAECHVRGVGRIVQNVGTASRAAVLPTQFVESKSQVKTSGNVTTRAPNCQSKLHFARQQ